MIAVMEQLYQWKQSGLNWTRTQVRRPVGSFESALDFHCSMISSRGRQGTSLPIMGLETIDPHSQKVHTMRYKIPTFGVKTPYIKRDTAI